jgi:N6-L-threonylcarbamoyladenine synthase
MNNNNYILDNGFNQGNEFLRIESEGSSYESERSRKESEGYGNESEGYPKESEGSNEETIYILGNESEGSLGVESERSDERNIYIFGNESAGSLGKNGYILGNESEGSDERNIYILGIETSCDDTSMVLMDFNGKIIENITWNQNNIHEKYQGIVPALASLYHLINIGEVWASLESKYENLLNKISLMAVTNGPGLTGSLLIGVNFAQGLSKQIKDKYNKEIPVILTDHIEGHLLINLTHQWVDFPFLGLILSGGHTLLVHCKQLGHYEVFGTTLDDAVGECLDKCGRFLNLPYPGGIFLEQEALKGSQKIPLPVPMAHNKSNNFSFSGLKTAVFNIKDNFSKEDISYTIQNVIAQSIEKVIKKAMDHYGIDKIVVGGGVISNKFFRQYFVQNIPGEWYFPGPGLSTDSGTIPASVVYVYNKLNGLDLLKKENIYIYNNLRNNKHFIFND